MPGAGITRRDERDRLCSGIGRDPGQAIEKLTTEPLLLKTWQNEQEGDVGVLVLNPNRADTSQIAVDIGDDHGPSVATGEIGQSTNGRVEIPLAGKIGPDRVNGPDALVERSGRCLIDLRRRQEIVLSGGPDVCWRVGTPGLGIAHADRIPLRDG